ncbi:hypothetical protein Tsubulata_017672 [Turnera subulata]|uniref:U3 small nucleolar RNA-associated protein 13 C-terminal domain-containing protein n=1 Tax=Turnera subulata TaxID=218843 RepID=A0A9Q0FBH9_9ROSI|nr:hypothetical protein Tsubulata_017672 [Turnera subulata]
MSAIQMKQNYRSVPSLQQFYSGGPFAVSSDGSFLACALGEAIKIVDPENGSIKGSIEGDTEAVTALALSPDDKLLFSASHSRQISVWELSTFKRLRSWKGHEGPVMSMACHASGGLLATGGADRKVRIWDVDGGFCTHHFKGHKGVVTCMMFHPDTTRDLLFSGSDDAAVRMWDISTKKCVATLEKHFSAVTSMAVSEDGWTLLTAGRDKVVNSWNLHDYACKTTIPTYEVLEGLCVINSGTQLAELAGSLKKQRGMQKTSSSSVCFITVGERGIVRMWDSERAACIYEQKSSDVAVSSDTEEAKRGFTAALILPLDQGLLCVTADQQFLFYSSVDGEVQKSDLILSKRLIGYNEEILDLRFLGEEEKFLAVATNLEQVRVYDLASMSCSYVLTGHTEIVLCLDTCVSSSGEALIVTGSKDHTVRVWSSEKKGCIGVGTGHMEGVGAVAFSKKGKNFFVSGSSDRTIKVWSLDGITDSVDQPINLKSKAVVAAHDKDINSLAVAPNDSLVCSGSQDRTACVWRLPDLVSVVVLKGHKRGIWSVEFSPVDQCVITASGADGLVKLWTVKTNECIATYDQHEDKVWALAVGRKTEMLATGGGDAVINLWHDSTASDKEEAFRQQEESILRGQELENAVVDADYTKAIQIAFELRRPHKLFELFSEICRKKDANTQIEKALRALGKEEFHKLFEYVREWNTKPKLCHVAQYVLFQVFTILPPTEILEIKGIGELLEALIPYCRRHFSRMDRLVRSTFLLDYTLTGMSVLEPETRAIEPKDVKPSDVKDVETLPSLEDGNQEQLQYDDTELAEETPAKKASKKRKSKKSIDISHKKVKSRK